MIEWQTCYQSVKLWLQWLIDNLYGWFVAIENINIMAKCLYARRLLSSRKWRFLKMIILLIMILWMCIPAVMSSKSIGLWMWAVIIRGRPFIIRWGMVHGIILLLRDPPIIWLFGRLQEYHSLPSTMNRLTVYSYLTLYTHGHARSGKLLTDPPYKRGQSNPAARQPGGRQAGPLFQDLTSGWIQPESDYYFFISCTLPPPMNNGQTPMRQRTY